MIEYMDIRTEAKIHLFLDKCTGATIQLICLLCSSLLMILLVKFFATNPVIIMNNNILTLMFNLLICWTLIPMPFFISIFIEHTPDIFDTFFANIKFKHDKILFCHLLLKQHHSSSKLKLELNKLEQSIKNKSKLYNDLNKDDFPYLTKLIERYYCYDNYKEKQNNNNKNIYNTDLDKFKIPNPQLLLTMDNVDDELNNLINNQFKNLNNEKQSNVINTTNKNHISMKKN